MHSTIFTYYALQVTWYSCITIKQLCRMIVLLEYFQYIHLKYTLIEHLCNNNFDQL